MGTENEQLLLPKGTVLQGRYRVDQPLRSGGFGNTYIVWDLRFFERLAMKEFFMKGISERDGDTASVNVSSASKPQFEAQRAKFNKEARRLRKLHHTGIVHVEDLFDDNGTSYYIMDYIGGGSLSELVGRNGPLSEERVREFLPDLLDALEYVHAQQMWHLDIKPGNILLNDEGHPVLIDFGASKQLGIEGVNSTSISMAFTQGYAPSEQIDQNLDRIGPWTDLYAVGATLYNLLTGKKPPRISDILTAGPDAFEFPKGISDQMRTLILWLMRLNPNGHFRPKSVAEVREFLPSSTAPIQNNNDDTIIEPQAEKNDSVSPKAESNNDETVILNELNQPAPFLTFNVRGVEFKMIRVEGNDSPYYIGETEVTQALWEAVMESNPSLFKGANRPVESISWNDCQEFIQKLNSITAKSFRLPKESEWEFAAKGGLKSHGYEYSGSNMLEDVGWYCENSGDCWQSDNWFRRKILGSVRQTNNVKQKEPNELGIYDMSGNVWEWCEDLSSSSGSDRVNRGGAWDEIDLFCSVNTGTVDEATCCKDNLGLRLAL